MFVVDTNVLLYAVDRDAPEHQRCREQLEAWRAQATPWYLTWGIVYEFLRVTTHRVFPRPLSSVEAWDFVDALLESPPVEVLTETPQHRRVLAEVVADADPTGNRFHDAHIATLMREHGLSRIVTRDTDFHRFPWLEVIDPLSPAG